MLFNLLSKGIIIYIYSNQGQYKQIANQTQMAMKHETSINILEGEIRELKVFFKLYYRIK